MAFFYIFFAISCTWVSLEYPTSLLPIFSKLPERLIINPFTTKSDKTNYSVTACLVSCRRICAFHNYYQLLTKIDCNAPVYVKGRLSDISIAFDKNQHDACCIKLEAYDIVLKKHLKHQQQRVI